MQDVAPALADVARTRIASLAHVPDGAPDLAQRSRIVAPLIARDTLMGYLYADLDGAFGRFHDADRDLLAMLASQAAVALDNAQWSQGLEQKVAERTAELQASNALIEQRANELAIINSIQEGMAAELDFQAIVDLVGDKLREVFATGDMQIRWLNEASNQVHALYATSMGCASTPRPRRSSASTGSCRSDESSWPIRAPTWRRVDWGSPCPGRTRVSAWSGSPSSRAIACWAASCSRITSARARSARRKSGCCRPSPRAWAWRSRTRACSTRRSAS